MDEIINVSNVKYNKDELLKYNDLLEVFNLKPEANTNRKRTLSNKIKPFFIVEEVKNDKGRVIYYKIIGKIDNPIINKSRSVEYKEEKDYLLLAMMSDSLKNRVNVSNINRVQKSGTAIAASFGLLNKVNINLFDVDSYEYKFIKDNLKLFNILNSNVHTKKKNLYNYINGNRNIDMSKSLMLRSENKLTKQISTVRLDEHYEMKDILDFNYDEYIAAYCTNRKTNKIFELMNDNEPENVIEDFRNRKFTDFNIYNNKNEYDLFQKKTEEYFLARYKSYGLYGYQYVCVRNLIINNNDYLQEVLNTVIDKKKVYYYKKKLNDDVINDLSSSYLKKYCNNIENKNFEKYKELLEICIRI